MSSTRGRINCVKKLSFGLFLVLFLNFFLFLTPVSYAADPIEPLAPPNPFKSYLGIGIGGYDDDWIDNNAVPLDFRYQYLVGDVNGSNWRQWNTPDGQFATYFLDSNGDRNIVPVFTFYMMVQSTPGVSQGEVNGTFTNLNNANTMKNYFDCFKVLMQKSAAFGKPVIVHVEPDLWGFMQQRNANPSAITAAVSSSGFGDVVSGKPNTFAGFAQALVALRDKYATNVTLGYHMSAWGSGIDAGTNTNPALNLTNVATSMVNFYTALGANFDVFFWDTSDRDAGYYAQSDGGAHFWDTNNVKLPHFKQYATLLKSVNLVSGKKNILWQTPFGNSKQNNTTNHWKDNRVEYFIGNAGAGYAINLKDFAYAGVVAIMFGSGQGDQTDNTTDSNVFRDLAKAYRNATVPLSGSIPPTPVTGAINLLATGTYRLATTQGGASPTLTSTGSTPAAGNSSTVQLSAWGEGGIPNSATGIVGVITNLGCTGGANFRFWKSGTPPTAANLNVPGANPALNLSSGFVAPLDSNGKVYLGLGAAAPTTCGYVVDVVGFLVSSPSLALLSSSFRLAQTLDGSSSKLTSTGTSPTAGDSSSVQLSAWGKGGIPTNATGIIGVLTNVSCDKGANFRFWTGGTPPTASNLNVPGAFPQLNLSTNFIAPLDGQGKVYLGLASGIATTCGFVVDVVGYLTAGSDIVLLSSTARAANTTDGSKPKLTSNGGTPIVGNASTSQMTLGGANSIPTNARGVIGILTNVSCNTGGNFRFWASSIPPNASNLNVPGANAALNLSTGFTAPLDGTGKSYLGLGSGNTATCGYIVDISGYIK